MRGFLGGASGKEPVCQCRRCERCWFDPWVGKVLWRRKWQPTPVFFPGGSPGQRILAGCSPRGRQESDTTGQLTLSHCLLSGFSEILLAGTVWELKVEVREQHALERRSLSPHLSARFIHQSPVPINTIYNREQLPSTRPKGDTGHPAKLQEALEHHPGGNWPEDFSCFLLRRKGLKNHEIHNEMTMWRNRRPRKGCENSGSEFHLSWKCLTSTKMEPVSDPAV